MTTEELREHLDYLRAHRFTWAHMIASAGLAVASCIMSNVETDREIHEVEQRLRDREALDAGLAVLRAERMERGVR